MAGFEASRALHLTPATRAAAAVHLASARVDPGAMAQAMRWAVAATGELIDPHTAIGLAAARAAHLAGPVVTLATAHPAKFPEAVERATGHRPALPPRVAGLFDRTERYDRLPADLAAIEAYVAERATPMLAAARAA